MSSFSSKHLLAAVTLALSTTGSGAFAATFDLDLVADGDSRWYEFFSGAFTQLDKGFDAGSGPDPALDGAFLIEGDAPGYDVDTFDPTTFAPAVFAQIGGGVDSFPNEANFSSNYSVEYDASGLTGAGLETAPITAFNLAFENDIADDDGLVGGYTSSTSAASGTVSLVDGTVVSVNGGASVTHTYDFTAFGAGPLPYLGAFSISGNQWSLLVDGSYPSGLGTPLRYVWDAHGTATSLVPEPSSLALVGLIGVAPFVLRRR